MERPKQEAPTKLKQVPDDLDTDKDSEKSENVPVSDGRDEHSTSSSGVTGDQTEAVQLSDSGSGEENIVSSEVVMETKDSNNPSTGIIKQTGSVSGHGNLQNIHSNGPLTIHQTTTVMNNPVLNGNPLVTYCTAIQEENKFNVRKLHAELGLRLNDTITKTQLEKLLFFFCNIEVFERRDVEQMRNFMNVWQELEMRGKIRPREYGLLEEAFRSIQHTVCHLDVVQEYMEKIRSEDGVYEGWNMRKYEVIETHEKMEEYIVAYKPLMVQRICFGTVFQNAVFGVVSVEGGEIRLTNGSVRLQVPPKAIDSDVIFSAFCDPPEPQFSLKPGDEPNLVKGDNIVKYSLPVRLGPQNTQFNIPVMLTVTNHSLPNFEKGSKTKPLNVYRKEADTDAWACVGACFFDGDNYLTARISLNHFSSYVLGMPVSTTSLPPLNVHILIAALAPTEDNGNELKVFFMMNDFDYIGGFINQNCLAVDCRTCLYLDPRSDVTVTWIRRRQEEPSSVQFSKEGYLRQELIQNLGVKTTFLSIVQPQDDECACLEKESVANEVYEDVLLLKQNDEIIAELLFNEPQLMPTQQSDQPDSVSPHPQAPTITMETQIRELPAYAISHLCQSIEPAVQMKILKDLGHIPQDMITPVDSASTNTDVLKQTWHTLSDKMDTLVNALVNCGCVATADYLCVEILKVPPVMPVPTLTKQKDFAAIEAVSGLTRSEMTELQAAKDMDIPDEEDVCRLNLRMVRSIMETMGLSMKGLTSLDQAKLRLKTEIIKRNPGRKNDKQKLAAILKKVKEDHERKSDQLISFFDAIETMIDSISVTDPLRKQFDIICGDYKNIFENQRKELKKRPHKLVVTGDLKAGKTSVTNNLLGETILPESFLYTARAFSEISYGDQDHAIAYPWDGSEPLEITPEDGKEFSEVFKEKIVEKELMSSTGVFKRIEIYLNNVFLKESEITVIDTPGLGANAETTQMVLEHLQDAFGLLFVLNTENRGVVLDQICELAHEITRATTEHRQFFSIKSAVFLGNKWDAIQPEYHELLSKGIQEKLSLYWPGFRSEQFVAYSAKDTAALMKEGYMSRHYCGLLDRFELLMSVDLDNKLRLNFSWIVSMLQKIIFGLDNFINRKMDLKNQKRTFVERITRLQEVTVKDFKALKKTLNKVGDELVARLKNFLLDESVLASLADWNVYEFRLVTNWEELKQQLYQCLTSRLDAQIRKWLMRNMEFQHTMETFQQKVVESVGIVGEELEEMMKLTSSQDEQKVGNSAKADKSWAHPYLLDSMTIVEHTHFGYLPDFSVSNVVSVSASIHPRGFTLPSMIRSYFRSRFEFEKYKGQPVEYLKKASEMLVKEYCNSKNGLHAQVVHMMEPCHEFIDWLTEVILEHMKKDKEMIGTFLSEESVDTQLKKEYPYRRASFEAVQKSLRHFELFSLQRMSNHVALFSLNDVAFSENDEAKICGGFDADIYQAALKILPTATLVQTDAVTKGGKKMMTANMTSIVEMKLLPSMKEEEFLSTTSGLGQSVQSSEKNWDGLGKGSTNCELSSCSEGYVSDIGAKVYAAFRDEIDCLEERKDVEKVAEWLDGLFDEPCSKDIDEHSLEDENYDSNTKKACHYNRRPPIVISGKMGHVSIRCIKRPILEKDIYQYLEEERCYSCHRCPHLVKFKGTCISENRVYHKLEPLQCSLRNFMIEILWSKPSISSPSYIMPRDTKSSKVSIPDDDDSRYNIIKDWLVSVLEGLVYLHAQGLTSLDLSLDSIAVDVNNVVKLTSISCPKRIFNFEQLRSMNEDDLRSYRYIALEVFEQGPEKGRYTSKSDMYAFGLLIWEILCGKVAFEDDFSNKKCNLKTADRFMEFIRSRRPVVCTSELCVSESGFVSHLEEIQNKSWAYDPNQRITSELCMELVQKDPCHSPMPVMRP